ncbi:peptide deformylase [Ruminococcaceae bacterium OttesenSCG-928-O06]|nr:peptide deformylase [Ruminococcaceae bacterium OttesenSCG-928-O06]
MVRPILRLGDEALYRPSAEVRPEELLAMRALAEDLHDTLLGFRTRHGFGRAIAAPQIGVHKRMLYVNIDSPIILVNPVLTFPEGQVYQEVEDDCMCFPHLVVRVKRYATCLLRYRNLDWQVREVLLQHGLAHLAQHEVDHLDGVLFTMRAVDDKAFLYRG